MAFTLLGTGNAITTIVAPQTNSILIADACANPKCKGNKSKDYNKYPEPRQNVTYDINDRGTSYERVKWIQAALNHVFNCGLSVDGYYGEKTEEQVRRFQTTYKFVYGLEVDGIFGNNTKAALKKAAKHTYNKNGKCKTCNHLK